MKILLFVFFIVFVLAGCSRNFLNTERFVDGEQKSFLNLANDFGQQIFEIGQKESEQPEKKNAINLPINFVSQSPAGDWGLPYQEACEESALIGAAKYLKQELLTAEIMDQEIKNLVEYEKNNLPSYTDNSLAEVKNLAENYFNLKTEIVKNVDIEKIEQSLRAGRVIIAPFAGRMLGNKFYSNKGPLYHFLIIRGFDEKYFYTNDVGTRHGENFAYEKDKLIAAMHDLPILENGEIFRPYDDMILSDEKKEELMKTGEKAYLEFVISNS